MTSFIIKKFIKDYENLSSPVVRENYGIVASFTGILANILLFVVKLLLGFFMNSISVITDSFNNLSDVLGSVVSLVGFKMASKPADKEHPFGHGRVEYLSGLIVSFIILVIGWEFLKTSVSKIRSPEDLSFDTLSVAILFLSLGVKLWLSFFNKNLGTKINSKALLASAKDCINDVFVTSSTIFSLIVYKVFGMNADGFIGLIISVLLLYGGLTLINDTLAPLLGEPASGESANLLKKQVESYDGIYGAHDLIIHDYGPTKKMATIHVEISNKENLEDSHALVDKIEDDILENLGIFLLIHVDPIDPEDSRLTGIRKCVSDTISGFSKGPDAHDFRIVKSGEIRNVVFELCIPFDYETAELKKLLKSLRKKISQADRSYNVIINVEHSYIED